MSNPDLDTLLREHGGLEGLARELGQDDPNAWLFSKPANENEPARVPLWRRALNRLGLAAIREANDSRKAGRK